MDPDDPKASLSEVRDVDFFYLTSVSIVAVYDSFVLKVLSNSILTLLTTPVDLSEPPHGVE